MPLTRPLQDPTLIVTEDLLASGGVEPGFELWRVPFKGWDESQEMRACGRCVPRRYVVVDGDGLVRGRRLLPAADGVARWAVPPPHHRAGRRLTDPPTGPLAAGPRPNVWSMHRPDPAVALAMPHYAIGGGLSAMTIEADGTLVYALEGEIDIGCSRTLESRILAATITTPGDVVIDLSEVTFIDSSGIAALLVTGEVVGVGGRSFRLANPQPAVRRLFEMVGVLEFFGIEDPN